MTYIGYKLWTALFIVLQLSIVLCGSTASPHLPENKGSTGADFQSHEKSQGAIIKNLLRSVINNGVFNESDVMAYDNYDDRFVYEYRAAYFSVASIIGIVFGVLFFLSCIIGCIVVLCCRKNQRRQGLIMGRNTATNQPGQMQQPQPATVPQFQPTQGNMQDFPPSYQPVQQPNQYQPQSYYPGVQSGQPYPSTEKETRQSSAAIEFNNPVPPTYNHAVTNKY